MECGTIGRGSRCGRVDESYVESSQARRCVNIINQASFTDPKFSHMLSVILKNMFNGSWTTWKEVNKTAHETLWGTFKEVVTDVLVHEVWEDTMKNHYPYIMLKARKESIKMAQLVGVQEKELKTSLTLTTSEIFELTHTKKGVWNGLHEYMKLKAELVWAMYKEAVIAKYGPDSSNHPIFDVDLWDYCSQEVTKGGLFRYKEAVVAKYGPDSSNHPIFDVDLWEYCSKRLPNADCLGEFDM
ncbi:hypothetical protein Tco_0837446 [Tanacetum coccineum]